MENDVYSKGEPHSSGTASQDWSVKLSKISDESNPGLVYARRSARFLSLFFEGPWRGRSRFFSMLRSFDF